MNISLVIKDLTLIAPAMALFLASLIPITIKVLMGNQEKNATATMMYGLMGVVAATGLIIGLGEANVMAFSKSLVFDGLSNFSALLVCAITAVTLILARENIATVTQQFSEFVFLLLNAAIGMMLVAWSNDLMMLFIGIEYMSLCLYILIAMSYEHRLSKEAAFKYFVLGSFASAILLYGIALIYGSVGHTYLQDITKVAVTMISSNRLFLFGVLMLIAGLGFKVAVFPFHSWAPDVYQGSPTPVTAFMATGVKVVTFVALLRVVATDVLLGDKSTALVSVMEWIAVLTMVVGNIAAIMQNNLKRLLAYSGIAHSGYAFIGVIAAGIGGQNLLGASGVMFYMLTYSIMTLGAFALVCVFEKNEETSLEVDDLRGLGRRHPWLAFCFAIFMLSLAGIPPLAGFFGKFFIFSAAIKQGLFWLALWGVLSSVISVYYYLRPLAVMYMREEQGDETPAQLQLAAVSVGFMAILVIGIGLSSNPFYQYAAASVEKLFFRP